MGSPFKKLFRKINRSAETGQIISESEAKNNPDTTVKETVLNASPEEIMDNYAQSEYYDDWEELQENSSKNDLTNHFKKILKNLKK